MESLESLWISGLHELIGQVLLKWILSVWELFCSPDAGLA